MSLGEIARLPLKIRRQINKRVDHGPDRGFHPAKTDGDRVRPSKTDYFYFLCRK
jgi:hypothetical protein